MLEFGVLVMVSVSFSVSVAQLVAPVVFCL